jgi:transcriptional regulator with XRE-family HTH domain
MHAKATRLEAVRLRLEKRLSLAAIAVKVGISKGTASLWLRSYPLALIEVQQRTAKSGQSHRGITLAPSKRMAVKTLFQQDAQPFHFRDAAIGYAVAWFMHRGYNVSLPVGQGPYDLVVDSDCGLQKVQVKSTHRKDRRGRFFVHVCKRVYDGAAHMNASGRRRRAAYSMKEVDCFFILTGNQDTYLIPRSGVGSKKSLTLDRSYACFRR